MNSRNQTVYIPGLCHLYHGADVRLLFICWMVDMSIWQGVYCVFFGFQVAVVVSLTGCDRSGASSKSNQNLKAIGIGLHAYHDRNKAFPIGGSPSGRDTKILAWQVALLPHLNHQALYEKYDQNQPWNDPANRPVVTTRIDEYVRTSEQSVQDKNGLALTHYSGSNALFRPWGSKRISQITDGTSNTLFVGEIGSDPPPWGRTGNARDPRLGLHGKATQFGRSDGSGAQFLLCDGTVRNLSSNVDPKILEALTTTNEHEDVAAMLEEMNRPTSSPKPVVKLTDEEKFQSMYKLSESDGAFRCVPQPPACRDTLLKAAFDSARYGDVVVIRPELRPLLQKNLDSKWPFLSPESGPALSSDSPVSCVFKQGYRSPGETPTCELHHTTTSLKLSDLLRVSQQPWNDDQLVFLTADGQEPDFGLKGDVVVLPLDVIGLMPYLDEYCKSGPTHLNNLRFRKTKRDISLLVVEKSNPIKSSSNEEAREQTYVQLCSRLRVSPFRSRGVLLQQAESVVSLNDLPKEPSREQLRADPSLEQSYTEKVRKEFRDQFRKKQRFADLHFYSTGADVVECYVVDERGNEVR